MRVQLHFCLSLTVIVLSLGMIARPALADQASTHYHKAMVFKRDGRVDQAIKELHQALELREDYAAAHYSVGILYRQKGNVAKAIYHLEQGARLEGKNAQIQYSLGLAYHKARRVEEAIEALTRAAALAPKDDQIQSALGTLLIRKDTKRAIPYLEAAVKIKPRDAGYLQQLGLAYRKLNQLDRAEKYLLQAAALKEDAITEFNLGVLYRRKDDQSKAIKHYEAAIRLDPKMAAAFWDVAHMYAQLKRAPEAIEAYESYLQLKGSSKDASIARERIKELKGAKKK